MINLLAKSAIEMIERGCVPAAVTRLGIRHLLRKRLRELERLEFNQPAVRRLVEVCDKSSIAPVPEKANEQHYEVPAEFYLGVLGPHLKYSCCYFNPGDSLEQAERNALAMTCENAGLEDGMEILELGCGWGSLSLWMAEHYPRAKIVSVSNSHSQRRFIEQQARQRGLSDRLKIVTCDMNDFQISAQFDRVVSVEMFEHMRNYRELLRRIRTWLKPAGKLLIHIFVHHRYPYEFHSDGASDWMARNFFSGGIMPTTDLMKEFDKQLKVSRQWTWSGTHYEKTCRAWIQTMIENRDDVLQSLQSIYGSEASRWWHRWVLFFEAGAELFGYQQGNQWQVAHLLFEPVGTSHERIADKLLEV